MKEKDAQKSDKRTAILEATLELIAEHGFHNAPTSQIAEKAGVGVGSIYRYFADKDALIHALFAHVIERQQQAIFQDYPADAPVREQYLRFCTRLVEYEVKHPKESIFVEQYFHSPYGLSRRREVLKDGDEKSGKKPPLHKLFDFARSQQIVKDLPSFVLGALTFGPLFMLIRDIQGGLIVYDPHMVYTIAEACWDAVKR